MISLYDHLGYAAGKALGKRVSEYAKIRKAKYGVRNIENRAYKGTVHTYEQAFLEEFFEVERLYNPTVATSEAEIADTLPF